MICSGGSAGIDVDADEVGAGGRFGRWTRDPDGEPAFAFRAAEPASGGTATVPGLVPAGGAAACWHAVANAGITATAHAGGWTTIWATSRGMVRLTGPASRWGLREQPVRDPDATFGLGHAEWTGRVGGARVTRRLAAPVDGAAVLRIDVTVEGAAPGAVYEEQWVAEPRALLVGALMSTFEPPPPGYRGRERAAWRGLYTLSAVVRAATNATRLAIGPTLVGPARVDPGRRAVVFPARRRIAEVPATTPAWFDRALPDLFVAVRGDTLAGREARVDEAGRVQVPLGGGHDTLGLAVGLSRDDTDLDRLLALADDPEPFSSRAWGGFARLEVPAADAPRAAAPAGDAGGAVTPDPDVVREVTWHAAALIAAEQHDDHFGRRYVAQGSAYGFVHGLQGAPRDYALAAVPLALLDPPAAREQLEVMMAMTGPSGRTAYAHTGRGQCTSGGLHAAPTDLPLFFLWALSEYVWSTGDQAFLDRPVPFRGGAGEATPRERARRALRYVDEVVGRGEHGLLRVGSGDWSDPISAMVADRGAFHEHGESGFNTAFAVHVLPRAAALVDETNPDDATQARELALDLREAMARTWTGSWFLRGWDGTGRPIGEEHLFLDGQVWALIAGIGSADQRAALVDEIARRCDDPSPIGATILDRPHDVRLGMLAPGWDCNGGVWATINALLAWGYAVHDPARAWASLRSQSLAAHARAYPDIWYGIWSGPDAYNAHFGSRPGETFVQPATPMREFPVMNSNAHAGPLLGLVRTLGIETDASGVVVAPRPGGPDTWRLTTRAGTFTPHGFTPTDR